MRDLSKGVLTLWRIRACLEYLILLGIALTFDLLHTFGRLPLLWKPPFAFTGLALALFVLYYFWYLPTAHQRWKYFIGSQFVGASYGIFWRTRRTVPRTRIQHVDITSGPFERMLGMVSLHLHTAGSATAVLVIPGLSPTQAERLRQELLSNLKGNAPASPT